MFATFNTNTAAQIASVQSTIELLQQQLDAARIQLSELQQQQQAEQTAHAAAETALQMVQKARKLVAHAYGADAVAEFNRTLVEEEVVVAELPASADEIEEVTPNVNTPAPDAPNATIVVDEVTTVDVAVETIEEEEEVLDESQPELDFRNLSWSKLQKLAASKKVTVKGQQRHTIQQSLAGLVTQKEINAAAYA